MGLRPQQNIMATASLQTHDTIEPDPDPYPTPPEQDICDKSYFTTQYITDCGNADSKIINRGAFLWTKTEITVESTLAEPFNDDRSSDRGSTSSTIRDEKRGRYILGKFGDRYSDSEQSSIHSNVWRSSEDLAQPIESLHFGTTISIEAAQPVKALEQELHEMKGLEQAASMKRWAGDGKPAEAWGKLMKDPELWDHGGDTLVYFGYLRPQASFRIKASLLENTKSDILISKLKEDFQRTARLAPSHDNTSASRGMKKLNMTAKRCRGLPTLSENGAPVGEVSIRHEIHFPAPDNASRPEILRHHITTRNFVALLLGKPLVGLTYYQALTDLHGRLMLYMPQEVDCAQLLIRYLFRNHLHNVSNDPIAAAGLLAWSENIEVKWQEGWREAFVHCVGMYPDLRGLSEARDICHASRTMLERSHLELQARIEACESRLLAFNFDDMWLASASQATLPRRSFDRLRHFLRQYYEREHKHWPPAAAHKSHDRWLTRELVQGLQSDFVSLYDYFVDRNRCWDKVAEHDLRQKRDAKGPEEDTSLTKLFLFFDKKHNYPHIPYPYPLLPASAADIFDGKPSKQSIFTSKSKTTEKRVIHACAESSNSLLVGPEVANKSLVEAFVRFEKTDLVSEANPREVRQGRWILLYGILQLLATISVDTPGLWFKDTPYFMNPHFKGNPPWRLEAEKVLEEANSTLSHCWNIPKTWKLEDWANCAISSHCA